MQRYNPYIHAIAALTNAPARAYYADRALEDVGTIIWVVNHAIAAAYYAGVAARAYLDQQSVTPAVALQDICTSVECTVAEPEPDIWATIDDDADWLDFLCDEPTEISIDVMAETIVEPITYLLPADAPIAVVAQSAANERFILNAIAPSAAALSLIKSTKKTDRRLKDAPVAKTARKPKTETKAERAPKARKPAGIAPYPAPLTVQGVPIS